MSFFTSVNPFWVVYNNESVIDAMNKLNKRRKADSRLKFATLYTKLPHNKLLMIQNSFIDFCFDRAESKYITVKSYVTQWLKNIKNNVMRCNKQQIKVVAVAYLIFNCYFSIGFDIFCQAVGIPMGSDPVPFKINPSCKFPR